MHEGGRSNLFFEFARIADELVPSGGHVLIENVPGLLSSNNGRDFAVLLATLAELGFHDLAWRIVDSRYFGVPQRRRRVFILGRRARGDGCAQVLLEPESGGGDFTQGGQAGPGAAGASAVSSLQSGGGERGYQVDAEGAAGGQLIAALTTRAGNTQDDQQSQQLVVAAPLTRGSASGEGVNAPGRRQEDDVNLVVADTVRSHPRPGSIIPILIDAEFSNQEEPKFNETGPLTRKLRKATTDGNAVRRLTPRECERLQGFPDNWTRLDDKTPDSRRYAALGDAVTVNVAEWIGRRLA
jgi:DNA (cytosine-5)-methyltransferase 1